MSGFEEDSLEPPLLQLDSGDELGEEWHAAWNEFVARAVAMRRAVIDGACRAAYLSGTHGVLVEGNTVKVTTDVPFGEVHYRDDDGTASPGRASEPPCRT